MGRGEKRKEGKGRKERRMTLNVWSASTPLEAYGLKNKSYTERSQSVLSIYHTSILVPRVFHSRLAFSVAPKRRRCPSASDVFCYYSTLLLTTWPASSSDIRCSTGCRGCTVTCAWCWRNALRHALMTSQGQHSTAGELVDKWANSCAVSRRARYLSYRSRVSLNCLLHDNTVHLSRTQYRMLLLLSTHYTQQNYTPVYIWYTSDFSDFFLYLVRVIFNDQSRY